ncbi:MAG: hypothetical protein WC869_04020 [Phycisphaerae bacterium]|jgi:hypothetical protein
MIAWEMTKVNDRLDPPTKEFIERDKQRQLEAVRALRRMVVAAVLQAR